jgi:hypothetical protein
VLRPSDIINIQLTPKELRTAADYASRAELGGVSRVRGAADRQAELRTDQAVGQLGELALSRFLGGSPLFYELTRTIRDLDPTQGDGGGDLLATNVDVKCSLMRASTDLLRYRLLVRPKERHEQLVYVLALVGQDVWQTGTVNLVGWARDCDLPEQCARDGPFAGAYVIPASQLYPLPPIKFNWLFHYDGVEVR